MDTMHEDREQWETAYRTVKECSCHSFFSFFLSIYSFIPHSMARE